MACLPPKIHSPWFTISEQTSVGPTFRRFLSKWPCKRACKLPDHYWERLAVHPFLITAGRWSPPTWQLFKNCVYGYTHSSPTHTDTHRHMHYLPSPVNIFWKHNFIGCVSLIHNFHYVNINIYKIHLATFLGWIFWLFPSMLSQF